MIDSYGSRWPAGWLNRTPLSVSSSTSRNRPSCSMTDATVTLILSLTRSLHAASRLVLPGAIPCKSHGPTRQRTSRKVGWPTAAVMRRTCRFLPSRRVSSSQSVGIARRTLIGGVRAHRSTGSSMRRVAAGKVTKSPRSKPSRNRCNAVSPMLPSTCTQYVFGIFAPGSLMRCCSAPSAVSTTNPSLSQSRRPAGYTSSKAMNCFSVGRVGCALNWHTTP